MPCLSPPELDESALLHYLDGAPDGRVLDHLAGCPHCRQRAQRLAHLQACLTAQLYRLDCPSPHDLGDYYLQLQPRRQAAAVARHLAGCPHCRRELALLQSYLGEPAPEPEPSVTQRITVLVAELISSVAPGAGLAPAYASVRGAVDSPRLYRAGQAQIAVAVQPESVHETLHVMALITGVAAQGWQARLLCEGKPVAQAVVDELGNVVLSGLAPAVYELIISGPDCEIHIPQLDLAAAW